MRLSIERRRSSAGQPHLLHVITPRTNPAPLSAVERLLAGGGIGGPLALEIAATREARWFLVRTMNAHASEHVRAQLGSAYGQAAVQQLDLSRLPGRDPARLAPGEQAVTATLKLRAPGYLPLRTFRDIELDQSRAREADPMLSILAALGAIPEHWRAFAQLALLPAPPAWCRGYDQLIVETKQSSTNAAGGPSFVSIVALAALLPAAAALIQGYTWWQSGQWLGVGGLGLGVLGMPVGGLWLRQRLAQPVIHDPRLIEEKIRLPAYQAQLRLALMAPEGISCGEIKDRLSSIWGAYGQFDLGAANGLILDRVIAGAPCLEQIEWLRPRSVPILNVREIAGVWHLPQAPEDAVFVERSQARRRLPLPDTVKTGCSIGTSEHQGQQVNVRIPDEVLRRHTLLVAKTRRGKSALLLRLVQHLMQTPKEAGSLRPTVVLVDPHRDLASAALGIVPAHRRPDVVYLDLLEQERPFGLNLIDVHLAKDRDKLVQDTLTIFEREFEGNWGPRMEDAFRHALLTLYEANRTICRQRRNGRQQQYTLLQIPALLVDNRFRQKVMELVDDAAVKQWYASYYDRLDRHFQLEVANPVQTKINRFLGTRIARSIVGQPASTIDPAKWVKSSSVVIVSTAAGIVGNNTAALLGATLINLIGLTVAEQAIVAAEQRRPVLMLVDEFHTMPGANYESILSELSKYGAGLTLATQSLAQIETLDREHHRGLRAKVFSNLDGLFVFNVSAEDGRYLEEEMGPDIDKQDFLKLEDYDCYARLSERGQRLEPFWVRLAPPPVPNETIRKQLAAASAAVYGRERARVDADIDAGFMAIEKCHQPPTTTEGSGVATDSPAVQPVEGSMGATVVEAPPSGPQFPREAYRNNPERREQLRLLTLDEPPGDDTEEQPEAGDGPTPRESA